MHYTILLEQLQVDLKIQECNKFIFRWNALGTCFERIDKKNESIKCFEKSESCKDKECKLIYIRHCFVLIGKTI